MSTTATHEIRDSWNALAEGYDRFVTSSHIGLGEEALRRADLRGGMRFLDVAPGSGALTIPAARLGAHVVGADISPVMVERLEARAKSEGLTNIDARVMDGHELELDDDSFDIAGSQFGVMLMPDLPRALRELRRVTRPGGRVLIVAYGSPDEIDFIQCFGRAIKKAAPDFPGLPTDPPPLPFQVADPEVLRSRLVEAGLTGVSVGRFVEHMPFTTGRALWDWIVYSNPVAGMLIAGLSDDQLGTVRESLDEQVRERRGKSAAAVLTSPINIGIGMK